MRLLDNQLGCVVENSATLMPEPGEPISTVARLVAARVDGNVRTAGEIEKPAADARPRMAVGAHMRDGGDFDFWRGQRQSEAERVVGIGADVGVENDAVSRHETAA